MKISVNTTFMSSILVLSFTCIITGCTTHPKYTVIVGSGTMYSKWQKDVLEVCSIKAAEVTVELVVKKSKEGMVFTESDVINIHSYLVNKCSMNAGIVI
jgi:hypothetical protein